MPATVKPRLFLLKFAAACVALSAVPAARAGVVVRQMGEQDFAAGVGPITVDMARAAGANEAAPFDGSVFGDDRNPVYGKLKFSYEYAPAAVTADGTLTLGLIGLDSPPGARPTVRLYLDGVEQPNAAFAGASSATYAASASVVSVPVPAAMLADGRLDVVVRAYRHLPGFRGNAIEADFSTLAMDDPTVATGGGRPGTGQPGDPGQTPGDGGIPGNGGSPGNGGTPGDGGSDPGDPDNGGGHQPGGNGGGTDPGSPGDPDGGHNGPPPAVPLPPAVFVGGAGLLLARLSKRLVGRGR